eukprot:11467645-Ditylum_brightwellii.AAC.1
MTVLRCGRAAGVNGPVVFVTNGSEVNRRFSSDKLHTVYGLPKGFCVMPNSNGYMDDETWLKVLKKIAPAIQEMDVIKDHPDWEACSTYDGLKSHVNVTEALELFAAHKMTIVKEESGSSDTNQAYDQLQAVADKQST